MTQEDKELLLKDLCARLPYGVKAYVKHWSKIDRKYYEDTYVIKSVFPSLNEVHVQSKSGSVDVLLGYSDYNIKPYLFPLSSMNEEQNKELQSLMIHDSYGILYHTLESFDWLNKNHFDYRGLIEKSLALDATGLNIY